MAKIISISNQKGGVGKTTTAVNLSASLAVTEKRVLLVDFDPQGNATSGIGIAKNGSNASIYQVIIKHKNLKEVIKDTELSFLKTVDLIKKSLNPSLEIEGILLTMFDPRNNLAHQVAQEVKTHFVERVFKTVIPRNVRLSESPSFGKPVILYDVTSKGASSYMELANEIILKN